MPKKKKGEPIRDHDVPHNCITCRHWVSRGEENREEYADIRDGLCMRNRFRCPPVWVCKGWEQGGMYFENKGKED